MYQDLVEKNYGSIDMVQGILYGIKLAVVAIIVFVSYRIGTKTLVNNILLSLVQLLILLLTNYIKFNKIIILSIAVFSIAMCILIFNLLSTILLRNMAEFFTKVALLTFSGAYAILPYIYQGGVEENMSG